MFFFFFKQKTAYEMRISDWSSDVCSSDLPTSALSENGLETMFLDTVPDRPIKDTKTERRFSPPLLLIKEHENLHHGLWNGHYLTYKHEIVGLAAPQTALHHHAEIEAWLEREGQVLRLYVDGMRGAFFTPRHTPNPSQNRQSTPGGRYVRDTQ